MIVLGIETSCDECSAALVEDGRRILSNVVATQIPFHAPFYGVVPEIASRKHAEWITPVVESAFREAALDIKDVDGVAVTNRPGLMGALLVGLGFAKGFAWARRLPFIACDHLLAHLYAAHLKTENGCCSDLTRDEACKKLRGDKNDKNEALAYPFLGLLVSGGHSIICKAEDFDTITVLGSSADDAVGEAFDKVAKHYGWGYPGGKAIDTLAQSGDSSAFAFPLPKPHEGGPCALSYSGLKTAVIHQTRFFCKKQNPVEADIAASFQKAAVETLIRALIAAVELSGITTVVAGGGVAANSYLRKRLAEYKELRCVFPPPELCGDNAAMVAALGWEYLLRGIHSPFSVSACTRVINKTRSNKKNAAAP
ncbi:MAG: tRNA (adenosine(37)-N6)-threonylcarbamoyltransferase complex transferase subunit TsaD [Termitinemataceae bacterium]|nr:MAG: tRNA (adenosine(37)-N6)-threonylcarbamoyltransferase complex transferase subunit TsaD [Termitinemataceae bacterium]